MYSCIRVDFLLKREFNYYLIQLYIPTLMMVILAWLSLWLDYGNPGPRMTLSALTLLVCAVMVAMFNQRQPKVSYTKAVDNWTGTCLTFIFSALVEFVIINWLSRRDRDESEKASSTKADGLVKENATGERKNQSKMEHFNALPLPDKVDYAMRILYPCVFLFFNIIYWPVYKN